MTKSEYEQQLTQFFKSLHSDAFLPEFATHVILEVDFSATYTQDGLHLHHHSMHAEAHQIQFSEEYWGGLIIPGQTDCMIDFEAHDVLITGDDWRFPEGFDGPLPIEAHGTIHALWQDDHFTFLSAEGSIASDHFSFGLPNLDLDDLPLVA